MELPLETFLDRVAESRLLTADELQQFHNSLPRDSRPTTAEELARELVKQKKLTAYQANAIYQGKTKQLVLGNYRVLDKLGQGGMGAVFLAEHHRMKRMVALKVVKPELLTSPAALKRFQREVETVARLDHPNIVIAHDADQASGVHFLVMQYVDGRDLSSLVKTKGPFAVGEAVDYVLQAARGLAYAHEQGIVHRDVKPGNMLLDRKGVVKILDLGLATLTARDAQANDSLTGSEMIVGTLDYLAPEQAQSARIADERSDIYSLGMTLWYLLTGRAAYQGDTVVAKLLAHQQQPIPSLVEALRATARLSSSIRPARVDESTVGPAVEALDELFRRMVAKRPEDRPQSMEEVVAALEAFQQGKDITTALASGGNAEPTLQWTPSASDGTAPYSKTDVELEDAIRAPHAISEQTASIVESHQDTTAGIRKPTSALPLIVSTTRRRVHQATWRQYSLVILAGVAFLTAAIGSPLALVWLSSPTGSIIITTNQPELAGATVSLDGEIKFQIAKVGPQKLLRLTADDQQHMLEITKDGFRPFSRGVRVTPRVPRNVAVHLMTAPTAGPQGRETARVTTITSANPQFPIPKPQSVSSAGLPVIEGGSPMTADRGAAELVLALGGKATIRIAGQDQVIPPGTALPSVDFELVQLEIAHQPKLTDDTLPQLLAQNLVGVQLYDVPVRDACLETIATLPKLEWVLLTETSATGAGLKHLRGNQQIKKLGIEGPAVDDRALENAAQIPNLDLLWMGGAQLTDAALAHLKRLTHLQHLNLGMTPITDAGVAHLRGLAEIKTLILGGCRVTDASVAYITDLKKLEELDLMDSAVTDAGLAILAAKGPKSLIKLNLEGTAITDAGLIHLKSLPRLRTLYLSRTPVTDEGLENVKGLKKLSELKLNRTKATSSGVEVLCQALPECQIIFVPPGKGKSGKSKAPPASDSKAK